MADYTIKMDDIEAFLDSKRDDEVIGITLDGGKCLVAEVVKAKYPEITDLIVCEDYIQFLDPRAKMRWLDIETDYTSIGRVVRDFDDMVDGTEETPITKRQWLEAKAVKA